jgi:hypothetical protein
MVEVDCGVYIDAYLPNRLRNVFFIFLFFIING